MADDGGGVASSRPGSGAPEYQTYVVGKGDSLWRIAEEQLGDPNRFADIAELNDGRRMPDGTVFSYAEFLQPGWVLIMPPDMGRHRPELAVEPVRLALESGGTAPVSAVSALAHRESTFATTRHDSGKTVAATGGLLAAGVVSALGERRQRKVMRRRPGERISMRPPGDWELELSRVDNPTGQVLVDAALRTLSAKLTKADRGLPDISMTVLKRHGLELHLARPQPPLAPFYADPRRPTVWICPLGAQIGAPPGPAPAPYPALVSMGFDEDDDTVLVDLEATGGVSLLAPEAESVSVLRAMAVELATGMAAEQVELTLVGFGEELPPLFAPGLLTHRDDLNDLMGAVEDLERWSAGVEAVLDRRGVTLRKARTHPDEELAPITRTHVLLSAVPPDPRLAARLRQLLSGRSRTSVAVVARATDTEPALSPWTIGGPVFRAPKPGGRSGIKLRVQALREERYAAIVRELSSADAEQEKPVSRDGVFNLPGLPAGGGGPGLSLVSGGSGSSSQKGPESKTPLPKRKPSHPRRHVAGKSGAGDGFLAEAAGAGASEVRMPVRAELIATPDPVQPNRFRVPVDDLFRVDALLPSALPTTTAQLPRPGAAKDVRLALKPANLPQFDQEAEREEEPPPPRPEDRVPEAEAASAPGPTEKAPPAPPALPAALPLRPAVDTVTPRKPGQWQGAYWSQRKAAAAGMAKPGYGNWSDTLGDAASAKATCAIDVLGPITLAGSATSADSANAAGSANAASSAELAEVAAYIVLHPGCPVRQMAEELWPARSGALEIVDTQLVRLRELLDAGGRDEQLLRVTPESVTLAPSVTCDWLEFVARTQNGELVAALSLVRGRPFENAPLRRYGWAETLRHEMAALVIDTAHYVAEACLREQSPRNARKAALRGLAAAPESELLYRDLLTALAALGDVPAARRHADTLLDYANREALSLQPETTALLRDVVQAASRS